MIRRDSPENPVQPHETQPVEEANKQAMQKVLERNNFPGGYHETYDPHRRDLPQNRVAVTRNVYSGSGRVPVKQPLEDNWYIHGYGVGKNNEVVVVVQLDNRGTIRAAKMYSREELDRIQERYNREVGLYIQGQHGEPHLTRADIRELKERAQELCEMEEISDPQRTLAEEVLGRGTLNGYDVSEQDVLRGSDDISSARMFFANMIALSPEAAVTAATIAERNIAGMHFTRGIALDGIVRHGGIVSTKELYERNEPVGSGEHIYQPSEGQPDTSFSNFAAIQVAMDQYAGKMGLVSRDHESALKTLHEDLNEIDKFLEQGKNLDERTRGHLLRAREGKRTISEDVAQHPDSLMAWLCRYEFPLAFGVSADFVRTAEKSRTSLPYLGFGPSELGEFRPAASEIPMDALPIMAVPEELVPILQSYLEQQGFHHTKVVPIEHLYAASHATR